jgi:class 3 adenylate cyclase
MTAMSIHQRMAAVELPNRIGVTTGEAFCGNVGSHKRCEYALYGGALQVVNSVWPISRKALGFNP